MNKSDSADIAIGATILLLVAGVYMYTRYRVPKAVTDSNATADTNTDYRPSPHVDDAAYFNAYQATETGSADTNPFPEGGAR